MIAIVNKGGIDPDPGGLRAYTVQINHEIIVPVFYHYRRDGLAECLRKAAQAVEDKEANADSK